jgi:hypothetical protein
VRRRVRRVLPNRVCPRGECGLRPAEGVQLRATVIRQPVILPRPKVTQRNPWRPYRLILRFTTGNGDVQAMARLWDGTDRRRDLRELVQSADVVLGLTGPYLEVKLHGFRGRSGPAS